MITKRNLIISFIFFTALSIYVTAVAGPMTNPSTDDEKPQIMQITQKSWEEWFFMARLEIGGQQYMFVDNFARTASGPNPGISQIGNSVILSQGGIQGILQPPGIHELSYQTYSLPSIRSSAPLIPSRPVETYLTFTSVVNPAFWYADGGTAKPSLTLDTDMTGYLMICDVEGYYFGQPVTGVGSYDHVWINNFDWEGFYYENWMWFNCEMFSGHIIETKDNSGTHYWSDGAVFFYDSGWEPLNSFDIEDVNDKYNYNVNIETPNHVINFQTSNPIYGSPYPLSDHVVFTISGTLDGAPFSGEGGNEVRRGQSPSNRAPPAPTLIPKSDQDYSATTVSWNPVTDPDGDPVTYNVRVGTSSGATDVLYEMGLTGTTSSSFDTVDGVTYYWSVQASDGSLASGWSAEDSFRDTGSAVSTITLTGPAVTEECTIGNGAWSTSNTGGSPIDFAVGSYVSAGIKGRSLIRWDLDSIPAGSRIISAEMSLYCYEDDYGTDSITINAFRLLRPWIEGTQLSADRNFDTPPSCCWIEYGNNVPWGSAGADASTDRSFAITSSATGSGTGWYTFDVTDAVEYWLNGSWANNGLILISSNEAVHDFKYFTSSESSKTTQHPRLVVTYEAP
jgi:hypothetical protein